MVAALVLAVGYAAFHSCGGAIYDRVRDADTLRGWGLSSDSKGFREWTVDRIRFSTRRVRADHLRKLWQLEQQGKIDHTPVSATAVLVGLEAKQEFPEELRREMVAAFLRVPAGDPLDRRLTLAMGSLTQRSPAVIDHLCKLLKSEAYGTALPVAAAESLGEIAELPPGAIQEMTRALVTSKNAAVRIELVRSLGRVSEVVALPDETLAELERIATEDGDAYLRDEALRALEVNPPDSGRLLQVLHELTDRDGVTESAMRLMGPDLRAVVDDPVQPAEWRAEALRRWVRRDPDHLDIPRLVMGAIQDEKTPLRAAGYELFTLLQRAAFGSDPDWTELMERGLTDPEPLVRLAATRRVPAIPVDESKRDAWLVRASTDADPRVSAAARQELRRIHPPPPPPDRTPVWMGTTFVTSLALIPILICIGYSLYYTSRIIVYLLARRWRALGATGVLAVWLGVSTGLGYLILIVVMGLGHAHTTAKQQAVAVAVYLIAMLLYFTLGWWMRRLVSV